MLLVRTPRADGARDTMDIWFAHIPDMERAVKAVEASTAVAPDRKVTVLGTIRHALLVNQLGVPEGLAKSFDGQPPQ